MPFGRTINQGCRLYLKWAAPLTQFNLILPPLPHNCDNSEKVKRENKHVLTIWDVVQLTAISNIYCKTLTPINRRGWGDSFAHKTRLFLCTAPWRGTSGLSFHHNQCQPRRFKQRLQTSEDAKVRSYQARRLTGYNYILKSLHFICMREGERKEAGMGVGVGKEKREEEWERPKQKWWLSLSGSLRGDVYFILGEFFPCVL